MLPPDRPPRPAPGSPADWLGYARSDLALAAAAPPAGVYLETLCYHAQQAAEKALKAVLVLHGERPPRTHDVLVLAGAVGPFCPVPLGPDEADLLTGYAVTTRYPADLGEVDEAEWEAAVRIARETVDWDASVVAGRLGRP